MGKKRRSNWKIAFSLSKLAELAPSILQEAGLHEPHDGMTLTATSGMWRKLDGSVTVKLVYKSGDGSFTKSYTLRGLSLDRTPKAGIANG